MSENEEMYLVKIALSSELGIDPMPLSLLAQELNLQPVSAHQMVKKLGETGKVNYTPYKGVSLSDSGKLEASKILRKRRLWEVFLFQHLGFSPHEADAIACQLEHIADARVVERLSDFLGSPATTPQGDLIPQVYETSLIKADFDAPLTHFPAGGEVTINRLLLTDIEKSFLNRSGLTPGASVHILAIQAGGECLIQPDKFPILQVSARLAENILVKPMNKT